MAQNEEHAQKDEEQDGAKAQEGEQAVGEQEEVRQAEEDDDEDPEEVVADGVGAAEAPLEDPASSTEPVNQSTDAA